MAEMTEEERAKLQKEQQEAQQSLDEMLQKSKPKNLRQGVGQGVNNIVGGAIGAVGIAVVAPTAGLAAGVKRGGVVGGLLGVTGGAVVGLVGGAAMLVGGAVGGVASVARGVAAMPKAIMAQKGGKWWNEATHEWVLTDLSTAQVPDNDDDLLKSLEDDLDAAGSTTGNSRTVKETHYYDVLEVDPKAEPGAIKRRYYLLARKYHPDKVGHDDVESADKFKEIAEAYQVLSDPQLREKYDKDGRSGLSGDRTEINDAAKTDPSILMAFLFGSDKFKDYFGRLATSTSAMLGDTTKMSVADARTLQERRCTRLAQKLLEMMQSWIAKDFDLCKTMWKTQAEELSNASFGWELVQILGMAYEVSAIQFLGSNESGIGMVSVSKWAKAQQASHKKRKAGRKNNMDKLMANVDAMTIQQEYAEKIQNATTDEEKAKLENEMVEATQSIVLRMIWTTTVVDITSTIHETCQMFFFDQSVDKDTRKARAHGVKNLGIIFQECPEPAGKPDKDAKSLFEDAALAAMVETMKRKDEANFNASFRK